MSTAPSSDPASAVGLAPELPERRRAPAAAAGPAGSRGRRGLALVAGFAAAIMGALIIGIIGALFGASFTDPAAGGEHRRRRSSRTSSFIGAALCCRARRRAGRAGAVRPAPARASGRPSAGWRSPASPSSRSRALWVAIAGRQPRRPKLPEELGVEGQHHRAPRGGLPGLRGRADRRGVLLPRLLLHGAAHLARHVAGGASSPGSCSAAIHAGSADAAFLVPLGVLRLRAVPALRAHRLAVSRASPCTRSTTRSPSASPSTGTGRSSCCSCARSGSSRSSRSSCARDGHRARARARRLTRQVRGRPACIGTFPRHEPPARPPPSHRPDGRAKRRLRGDRTAAVAHARARDRRSPRPGRAALAGARGHAAVRRRPDGDRALLPPRPQAARGQRQRRCRRPASRAWRWWRSRRDAPGPSRCARRTWRRRPRRSCGDAVKVNVAALRARPGRTRARRAPAAAAADGLDYVVGQRGLYDDAHRPRGDGVPQGHRHGAHDRRGPGLFRRCWPAGHVQGPPSRPRPPRRGRPLAPGARADPGLARRADLPDELGQARRRRRSRASSAST